ncbi:MAG: glycogen/starch synthase [Ignavibacteriae bacterium]|nr:glycogen/starch synthase [Ignavibacteriota bacterium]
MNNSQHHVIMVASENAALSGGKVGGVGDVVRDIPLALASLGWESTVLIPSYGFLHLKNPSRLILTLEVPFRGQRFIVEFWEAESKNPQRTVGNQSVRHILVHHPWISGEPIYFNDPSDQPFARDASKYALFSSAVGKFLRTPGMEGVLHLHDWHTATLLLLRDLHPEFFHLHKFKTIYTIHNLGIQGTRPMRNDNSSLEAWFPELFRSVDWVQHWKDPRYDSWMYTPMFTGIRFAHLVNTVSPTYSQEILRTSNHTNGFFGGEGLEPLLQFVNNEGRLHGILNGCEYPETVIHPPEVGRGYRLPVTENHNSLITIHNVLNLILDELKAGKVSIGGLTHEECESRFQWLQEQEIELLLTSVTRVTEQKVRLFCEKDSFGTIAIDSIAASLNEKNGIFIMLGTGTPEYERYLSGASRYHERFLFVRGFSEKIAQQLYASGTMFLMPSLYEPCGISQMVAMREGQPCVVHGVGGLKDTVWHDVNGFVFEGWTMSDKVNHFIGTVRHTIDIFLNGKEHWERIKHAALDSRFRWEDAARNYVEMYKGN